MLLARPLWTDSIRRRRFYPFCAARAVRENNTTNLRCIACQTFTAALARRVVVDDGDSLSASEFHVPGQRSRDERSRVITRAADRYHPAGERNQGAGNIGSDLLA